MNYQEIFKYELGDWVEKEGWEFLIAAAEHGLIKAKETFSYEGAYDVLRSVKDYKMNKYENASGVLYRFAQAIKHFQFYNSMEDNYKTFWNYLCPEEKIFRSKMDTRDNPRYMHNGRYDAAGPFRQFHNATFSSEIAAKLWILYRLDDFQGGCCRGGEGGYKYIGLEKQVQRDGSKQFHALMISDMITY